MKPTSIVFLILSAILIVSGIIICFIAGGIAKNDNVELYVDYIDDAGNAVIEQDLSGKKLSDLSINIKEADISIVGNSAKSYVKIENIPTKAYDFWITDGVLTIKDANLLSVFSSFRISESGFGFTGLRHYLALGKYKGMPRKITVYLERGKTLSTLDITLEKGEISFTDIEVRSALSVDSSEGGISLNNLTSPGVVKISCGTGDIKFDKCMMSSANAEIKEKGSIECLIDMQYSFALKCVSGGVYLDSVKAGSDYSGLYPAEALERKINVDDPDETEENGESAETKDNKDSSDKKDNDKKDKKDKDEKEDEEEPAPRMFVGRVNLGDIKVTVDGE